MQNGEDDGIGIVQTEIDCERKPANEGAAEGAVRNGVAQRAVSMRSKTALTSSTKEEPRPGWRASYQRAASQMSSAASGRTRSVIYRMCVGSRL